MRNPSLTDYGPQVETLMLIEKNSSPTMAMRLAFKLCLIMMCCLWPAWVSGQSVSDHIRVYVTVMDPQTVADVFGKRIAERFVAIQVTIANRNDAFQFLLHDVSLDLEKVFPENSQHLPKRVSPADRERCLNTRGMTAEQQEKCREIDRTDDYKYELSSLELSLLRGVAEKGQGQNRRNKLLRLFEAIGTIAAGAIGVASFGPSYAESVAVFNGPLISAYRNAFPDYTINQMNRLSDSAYQSNTLVPKQQAKVIVAFIPQSIFLSKEQQKLFWKDPTRLFTDTSLGDKRVDFRRTEAIVRGSFIVELENLPISLTVVQFDDAELKKFQNDKPSVSGYISGRFPPNTRLTLLNQEPTGLSVRLDGTPSSNRLNFIVESDKPVAPDTLLTFEVSNDKTVQTITRRIRYMPDLPTITEISVPEGTVNTSVLDVEITGTNFIPGKTRVLVTGNGVDAPEDSLTVMGATKLKAKLRISQNAATTTRQVTIVNPAGESGGSVPFKVVASPTQ